jgi:hypothetical protein
MAKSPLLIIFQQTLQATAFCLQHLENVADWLWVKTQAENFRIHSFAALKSL